VSFGEFLWSLLIIYAMIIYFVLLFRIVTDLFRSHDMSGFVKALWFIALLIFPFVSILIYVIVRGQKMAERSMQDMEKAQAAQAEYIRNVAASQPAGSSAADQVAKAHDLHKSGAITDEEYAALKAKALA
jgi:ABC-type multidrug transport system fused ATPase/permease subunit